MAERKCLLILPPAAAPIGEIFYPAKKNFVPCLKIWQPLPFFCYVLSFCQSFDSIFTYSLYTRKVSYRDLHWIFPLKLFDHTCKWLVPEIHVLSANFLMPMATSFCHAPSCDANIFFLFPSQFWHMKALPFSWGDLAPCKLIIIK